MDIHEKIAKVLNEGGESHVGTLKSVPEGDVIVDFITKIYDDGRIQLADGSHLDFSPQDI